MADSRSQRYKQCHDCIFFDVYADSCATNYVCCRAPLNDDKEYRDLSSDINAFDSSDIPCEFKVSIDRVCEIIKERMKVF